MLKKKCPYFELCGGCVWQNLSTDEYIAKKQNFVSYSFRDVGIDQIPIRPLVILPTGIRRRASFSLIKGHIGFNQAKSHRIIEIEKCPLLTPIINKTLPVLRTVFEKTNLTGDLFVLDTDNGIDLHIKTKSPINLPLKILELLTQLAQTPQIIRLVYNQQPLFEKIPLPAFADTFMQPSKIGEETLIKIVLDNIESAKNAVDLFCGRGTFTRPLLQQGITTIGYDSVPESVQILGKNGCVRDLFRSPLTPSELKNVDLVVLDPPRAGALAQVQQLANTNIPKIIMISCDPKTAARDCHILLQSDYQIESITPIDQFTYSNHIEIVVVLIKK